MASGISEDSNKEKVMEYFIFVCIVAAVVAKIAIDKGQKAWIFFLYALFIWPIALAHVLIIKKTPKQLGNGFLSPLDKICANCGYAGEMMQITKGSTLIELILWCCIFIPGLIYSIWRLNTRHDGCPQCGSTNFVPLNSPRGKKLANEFGLTVATPINQSSENN